MTEEAMPTPLVSVIITGDASKQDTLTSVHEQTQSNYELIIAETRNQGIRSARGEYLAFLYAGHRWRPAKLERQLGSGSMWCACQASGIEPCTRQESTLRALLLGNFIPPSSVIARRDVFDKVGGFDEALDCASADWDMWLRLAGHYPLHIVAEHLVELEAPAATTEQSFLSQLNVIESAVARHQELRALRSQALAGVCVSAGNSYLDANEPIAARDKFEEALIHDPLRSDPYWKWISSFFSLAAQHRTP